MPFNLDTYDETGRDFNQHDLSEDTYTTTNITLQSSDHITQAVIENRLMQFINNLGDSVTIGVTINTHTIKTLDNLDF